MSLDLDDRRPYQPQSTTGAYSREPIQSNHLNGNIWHEALEAAGATPFCLSFQSRAVTSDDVICNYDVLHS